MEGRKISDTRKGSGRTLLLKFSYFLRTKKQEQPRKSFYTQEQDTTYTMSKTENIMENLPSNQKIEKGMENVRKEIHAVRSAPGIDATGHQILSDTEQVYSSYNFRFPTIWQAITNLFFSQVLTSAERLLREKNEGDKIQELLREGQKATMELQHQVSPLQ